MCQSHFRTVTVKPGQAYPPTFNLGIDYLKNKSVSCSSSECKIQIYIPACVISSEDFTMFSLYLVRVKMFEWIKLNRRLLHQI